MRQISLLFLYSRWGNKSGRLFRICSAHQTLTINTLWWMAQYRQLLTAPRAFTENKNSQSSLLNLVSAAYTYYMWFNHSKLKTHIFNLSLQLPTQIWLNLRFWPHLGYLSCKVSIVTLMHLSSLLNPDTIEIAFTKF